MTQLLKVYGDTLGPLNFPVTDEQARDLEKDLDSGEFTPLKRSHNGFECFIKGERSDVSVICSPSVDKEGDVLDPVSLDFTNFRKNPVVAYNHRYDIPPVGKSLWQKTIGQLWKAKTQYFDRPEKHPESEPWFPESIWSIVQQGGMKGKSLGGVTKWREPTQEDADRLKFDLSKAKRISEKARIYEYSCCPIAMSDETLVEAITKKSVAFTDDILQSEFPSVWEALQKSTGNNDPKVIKAVLCLTEEEHKSAQVTEFKKQWSDYQLKAPELIDTILARVLGRVEV